MKANTMDPDQTDPCLVLVHIVGYTVKPVLSGHLKEAQKIVFRDR